MNISDDGSFSGALNELVTKPISDEVHKILWKTLIDREPSLNEYIIDVNIQKMMIGSLQGLVGAMMAEGVPQNHQATLFAVSANLMGMVVAGICTKYDLVNKASLKLE